MANSTHKHSKTPSCVSETSCAVSKYIAEQWEKLSRTERQPVASGPILFTKGRQSVDATRPDWARQYRVRRGVDTPFVKPLPNLKEPPVVLVPPPRTHSSQALTSWVSHYSVDVSDQLETASSPTLASRTPSVFPRKTANPDLPIPCPRLSQWVSADSVSEITAFTESIPSR